MPEIVKMYFFIIPANVNQYFRIKEDYAAAKPDFILH